MTFRIAQISDTHLSREKPFFNESFARVAEHLIGQRPDLVINSGDMALDGPSWESDLAEARRLHEAIGLPCRFIAANHDCGESQDAPAHPALSPLTHERRERYLKHFGEPMGTRRAFAALTALARINRTYCPHRKTEIERRTGVHVEDGWYGTAKPTTMPAVSRRGRRQKRFAGRERCSSSAG